MIFSLTSSPSSGSAHSAPLWSRRVEQLERLCDTAHQAPRCLGVVVLRQQKAFNDQVQVRLMGKGEKAGFRECFCGSKSVTKIKHAWPRAQW